MAEAAVIGAATDAAKGLTQLMAARALDEVNLALGFEGQLEKLKQKFEYIQAFLEDASNSKYAQKSRLVNLWVQKVKDAAYLADDVMDEYAIEIFRREMEFKNRFNRKFRNFFTLSNPVYFRLRMAHKVSDILSLFDEIDKGAKDIGLSQVDVTTSFANTYNGSESLNTRQYAAAEDSEFIGREKDQAELLDFICSPLMEEQNLTTVAIVGMGGMGKTTSARHLYDHEKVCAHFGKKIWICVSENFEVTRILNEMVESVTSRRSELSNSDAIIRKLQEELRGKKLLLVFDDVWNEKEHLWGSLKGLLHVIGICPGSVILTTTRSDEVAKAAGAELKHKLEVLSNYSSWSLLCHIISNNGSRPINCCLAEVGKRIVKKCKGVPLAIKVIGGLLRSKQHLHEWELIEGSPLWDLPEGQQLILPSLLLSFDHLPSPSIKQCFAYCATIPASNCVSKSELIGLWLSQGFLHNDKRTNVTPEKTGEEYLKILLSNSLLECVSSEFDILGYMMHDFVYDLAVYVCGNDLIKEPKDLCDEGSCRHLIINYGENETLSDLPSKKALTKLRTLGLKGSAIPWNILVHTRYLRTLSINGTGITEVPPAVALLKYLRFLDVSDNPISSLPDSICQLYQLQTLILKDCTRMKKLPKIFYKLVNLRRILTTGPMFAMEGLRELTNLQNLPSLYLDNDREGWTIDELGNLTELKDEVHIFGLENVKDKENAKKADLGGKANITKLYLSWVEGRGETGEGSYDENVLEGLEPCPNITLLEICNFIGARFPTWVTEMAVLTAKRRGIRMQLNNLTMVKLLNCSRCQTLPKLGHLPLLKFLTLSGLDVECIDSDFYGGDNILRSKGESFKCLKEFDLSGFNRLALWKKPPKGAFTSLETLRIADCKLLKSVPMLGINSLMSLQLEHLHNVESLDIIKYTSGLTSLILGMLPRITNLPKELKNCRKLQTLQIGHCHKLVSLPRGLESLFNLQSLRVRDCGDFNFGMDDALYIWSSLHTIDIVRCPNISTIPSNLEESPMLDTLQILKCPMIEISPTSISKLRRLSSLRLSYKSAEDMRSVLAAAKDLPLLSSLEIEGFRNEKEMSDYFSDVTPFLGIPSLIDFMLSGGPNIKCLPQQLLLLTHITALYFWDFTDLEEIPTWICKLSSLRYLIIEDCNNLKGLPSKEALQCIISLRISGCPLLVGRYSKDEGSQWYDISHIRTIIINNKTIQDS